MLPVPPEEVVVYTKDSRHAVVVREVRVWLRRRTAAAVSAAIEGDQHRLRGSQRACQFTHESLAYCPGSSPGESGKRIRSKG